MPGEEVAAGVLSIHSFVRGLLPAPFPVSDRKVSGLRRDRQSLKQAELDTPWPSRQLDTESTKKKSHKCLSLMAL